MLDRNILDQLNTDFTTLEQRALTAETDLKKVEGDLKTVEGDRDYHRAEANRLRGIVKRLFDDAADFFGADPLPEDGEAIMSDYPAEAPVMPPETARKPRKAAKAPQPVQAAPIVDDGLTDDDEAILKGLTTEWQTVLQLHKSAVTHGFSMGNQTVRNRMLRHIMVSEHGVEIETRASKLAWRVRSVPVDPKPTKAEAPADPAPIPQPKPAPSAPASSGDGLAELRAAIERATGATVKNDFTADRVKLSGHMSADERYARDRLLLKTLGDDAKGKHYGEWKDALIKAGGEEVRQFNLEGHRHRLAKVVPIERVTGLRGMGHEPRYRVCDLKLALIKLDRLQ